MSVDEQAEQEALLAADIVVMQFPVYWFSTPALLKEWQDVVLQNGFAYGKDGNALHGKQFMLAASSGADAASYSRGESHGALLVDYLSPLEMTGRFCGMDVLPAFISFNARHQPYEATKMRAHDFCRRLSELADIPAGQEGES